MVPYWKEFVNASPEEVLQARLDTKWKTLFPEMQALPNRIKKMSTVRNHVHIIHKHKYTDTERKKTAILKVWGSGGGEGRVPPTCVS